jgi:hypothetical protein
MSTNRTADIDGVDHTVLDHEGDRIVSNLKPERQIIAWQARAVVFARGRRYRDAARCRLRALELQRQLEVAAANLSRYPS